MKIRRKLNKSEKIDRKYTHLFLGQIFGVGLSKRGVNDSHICLTFLIEDDENWSSKDDFSMSSFWLPETIEVLEHVQQWLEKNAVPETAEFGYHYK